MPCEHVLAARDGLFTSRIASSHYVRSIPGQLSYLVHVPQTGRIESQSLPRVAE